MSSSPPITAHLGPGVEPLDVERRGDGEPEAHPHGAEGACVQPGSGIFCLFGSLQSVVDKGVNEVSRNTIFGEGAYCLLMPSYSALMIELLFYLGTKIFFDGQ